MSWAHAGAKASENVSFSIPVHMRSLEKHSYFFKMANSSRVSLLFANSLPKEEIYTLFKSQKHKYFCQMISGDVHRNIL